MNNQNKTNTHAAILLICAVAISTAIYGLYQYYISKQVSNSPNSNNKNTIDLTKENPRCAQGWELYKQDIIGISFCYPSQWGKPVLKPNNEVTRLDGLLKEYTGDNLYNNKFSIFFGNSNIEMSFFDDLYKGEQYPNSNAYQYGYIDNIPDLKKTKNICDYKLAFDHTPEWQDTIKEIYNECQNTVKVSLSENAQYFDKVLYSYDLEAYAFKKLQNGYFNNLLISSKIDSAHQIKEKLTTLDEFFNMKMTTDVQDGVPTKNKVQFGSELQEFKKFIDSITIFKPVPKTHGEFKIIPSENPDITAIRKYFWLIVDGKLEEAYSMRSDTKDIGFEDFQDLFDQAYSAKVSQIEEKAQNQYRFLVDYQDHNSAPEVYRIEAKITDGKLAVISTEKMIGEKERFGNMEAFAKQENGYHYVILVRDGKEIIVDKAEIMNKEYTNIDKALYFTDPKFSPLGNYLTYNASGWEWEFTRLYDIKNKTINSNIFSPYGYGFTEDEKYFYDCEDNTMSGELYGRVYGVPGFNVKYELPFTANETTPFVSINCEYNKDKKAVIFNISTADSESEKNRTIEYSPAANKATYK